MQNILFLKNKIDRQIKMNGQTFYFERHGEDQYHQTSSEVTDIIEVEGLFHTTNVYISSNTNEGSRSFSKPQPMILTLYDQGSLIQTDDQVEISDQRYKVVDKININQFDIAFDISLELIK